MKKKGRVKIQYRFDRAQVLSYVLSYAGRVDVRSSETRVFHPRRNGTLLAEKKADPPTTRHVNHHMVGETWLPNYNLET